MTGKAIHRHRHLLATASVMATVVAAAMPMVAVAQETGVASPATTGTAGTGDAGEIIVTAQKRSERISDVPMSISAATGEQLAQRGVTQVADLAKVVPGFTFQPSNYGTPVYSIRGIGFFDQAVAVAPTVSVYVDQIPLPYSVMTEGATLDLERVEALKGPQGTLFGENSTGGAINFIANKPTDRFAAGGSISYGNFASYTGSGYVSGPLSSTLTARLAASTDQRGDWQRSQTRDAGLGERNFSTARLLLDWKPSDSLRFEVNLNGWMNKSDTQAAQFVASAPAVPGGYPDLTAAIAAFRPAPKDNRVADWDAGARLRRDDDFFQASLRADWDIADAVTLTSLTSYSELRQNAPSDTDGTPYDNFRLTIRAKIRSFAQELRLSGTSLDDRLRWMLGGNYEHNVTHDNQFGHIHGTNSGVGPIRFSEFVNSNNQDIETKALFGSLDFKLTDRLTASGSLRYTRVGNDFQGCPYDTGDGQLAAAFSLLASAPIAPGGCVTLDPTTLAAVPLVQASLDEDNLSWRAGLSWKADASTLLYANVTRGYKAGSFPTIAALTPVQYTPVTQESVLAYEAGFKKGFFGQTLQVTGAAFYYDYKNKQIQGYIATAFGNAPALVSIPKGSVRGAELNITWKPVRALTLSGGATYVDTRVDAHFLANDPFANPVDLKGEQFPNTPKWQLNGDAQYDFPLGDALEGYVGGSVRYRSDSYAAFGRQPAFELPGYAIVDLRAGIQSATGRWRAEIWGRNVTDKYYATSVTHVLDTVARLTGMPATYGATFTVRY
ncbi:MULTISPECIES: TonB-dependent receptor [unclassified Sphingobium]|uniref:TonB-dependent receptor n=1 Tax=unclassified Sphingobium TaxID=2611147 RepID=UPI0035A6BB06